MEHWAVADRFGLDPTVVRDEWAEEDVRDVLQLLGAEYRYQLRHPQGQKSGLSGKTGIPLE
jgi:hypothetical protein